MTVSLNDVDIRTRLDELTPIHARVGWGSLGTAGSLGYEGKHVSVGGTRYRHALSTHPPARVLYYLGGRAMTFRARVALNDDVRPGRSYADFSVVLDGREVATVREVYSGQEPRTLEADVSGGHLLELVTTTTRFEHSHAVWLEPELDGELTATSSSLLRDCLERVEFELPPELPQAERCIATVVSAGYEHLLDDMLGSLVANGGCADALLVVFIVGSSPECDRVIAKYHALPIACRPVRAFKATTKSVLYSIGCIVDARRYLCLDADTLVLGDLGPVFAALDTLPAGSILAAREGNSRGYHNLAHILGHAYSGQSRDIAAILSGENGEADYPLVVNDGVFAGTREALLALDGTIRAMPGAVAWVDERRGITWRNQFVFNLALACLDCGVELDETYNVQLHTSDVEVRSLAGRPDVRWEDRPVRILHVNGAGRNSRPELSGLYASVPDPLVGAGDGNAYAVFLGALRAWLGRYGVAGLTWSFYGMPAGDRAAVRDPSVLPVLALLHYLVRANGCASVLETGTARGVSAACLASAVAHRGGARVVTLDPYVYEGREALWNLLPEPMRACLEPRAVDSHVGLRQAIERDERFDAALLDSVHTEEHLWAEIQLASRLVRPGGLMIAHDWRCMDEIQRALVRAEAAGFSVVRLLGGVGVDEDAGLGLALFENRQAAA